MSQWDEPLFTHTLRPWRCRHLFPAIMTTQTVLLTTAVLFLAMDVHQQGRLSVLWDSAEVVYVFVLFHIRTNRTVCLIQVLIILNIYCTVNALVNKLAIFFEMCNCGKNAPVSVYSADPRFISPFIFLQCIWFNLNVIVEEFDLINYRLPFLYWNVNIKLSVAN